MRLMDSEGRPMDLNISRSRSYCDLLDCLDLDLPPKENVLKNSRIDMIILSIYFNFFAGFSFLDMEGSFLRVSVTLSF